MVAIHKTNRREYNTPKKARFRALVEDVGWLGRKAATKVKVNQSTASRWLKQASEHRTGKFRPSRPRILTEAQLDCIEKWCEGHYEHRIMSFQDIILLLSTVMNDVFNLLTLPITGRLRPVLYTLVFPVHGAYMKQELLT
jgi:hypothetical protein